MLQSSLGQAKQYWKLNEYLWSLSLIFGLLSFYNTDTSTNDVYSVVCGCRFLLAITFLFCLLTIYIYLPWGSDAKCRVTSECLNHNSEKKFSDVHPQEPGSGLEVCLVLGCWLIILSTKHETAASQPSISPICYVMIVIVRIAS